MNEIIQIIDNIDIKINLNAKQFEKEFFLFYIILYYIYWNLSDIK